MNADAAPPRRKSTIMTKVAFAASIAFLVMVPFSFASYTSLGFDREYAKGQHVVEEFYRIRWPGDGSFRMGCGVIYYTLEEEDVDPIDLAARFFQPPQFEPNGTSWKRFDVARGLPEGDKGQMRTSTWLIVPSWFPGALLLIGSLVQIRRRRKQNA
jgi:hypothetical protein